MTNKPDLTRVWAGSAPAANVEDPDITTPGKFSQGWVEEVPTFENFNFLQRLFTQALAHINENGIAVWDEETTYPVDALVKGSDGEIYIANVEQAGNDPTTDNGTNWESRFGTAAGTDLQTSPLDTSLDKVLISDAFGLGQRPSLVQASTVSANGFYLNEFGTPFATSGQFPFIHCTRSTSGSSIGWQLGAEIAGGAGSNNVEMWARVTSAIDQDWSDYVQLWHSGNLEIQETSDDTTIGRVMKVGAFGIGSKSAIEPPSDELSNSFPSGIYKAGNDTAYRGEDIGNFTGAAIIAAQWDSSNFSKILLEGGGSSSDSAPEITVFSSNFGVAKEPAVLWHSQNVVYSRHQSSGTVSSNSVIGGANLNPPRSGSWRNISTEDLQIGEYGLWKKQK